LKSYTKIKVFSGIIPSFIFPPLGIAYDAYAGLDPDLYFHLGQFHANKISKYIKNFQRNKKLMVWGCGPMRVLRHLPDIFGSTHSFIGLAYNKKTIKWAKTYFPD
jgi:hypothetical protein